MILGLAILCMGALGQEAPEVSAEVAREWRVRALALGEEAWPKDLAQLEWEERCLFLDAVRRADPASIDERAAGFVMSSLSHEHSNVRALAIAAARRLQRGLPPGRAAVLARDLLPEVRLELATSLFEECDPELRSWSLGEPLDVAEVRGAEARGVLLGLALDPDARVSSRASAGLLALGAVALEEQQAWWSAARVDDQALELLRALEHLSRGPENPELARWGRERFARGADRARAALWETCVEELGLEPSAEILARGWTVRLTGDAEVLRSRRLLGAARAGGSELAALLLQEAQGEVDAGERLELAAGFAQAVELGDAELFAQLSQAEDDVREAAWEGLFGRADAWDPELAGPWLGRGLSAGLRGTVFGAVAETLSRTGDEGSREVVEALLEDVSDPLFDAAFRALCDAPDPGRSMEVLYASWIRTVDPRRSELLRSLPREVIPVPFRDELLKRWRPSHPRDVSSLELLALFAEDAGVVAAIRSHLAEHVAAYEERGLPADPRLEGRLIRLIPAAEELCGEEVLGLFERALGAGASRSKEVVKACAAALQASEPGRLLLTAWIDESRPSRARIEAAILVGELRAAEATEVLIERYGYCDPPLRVRILRALGRLAKEGSPRFLERIAIGVGLDGQVATEAITKSGLLPSERVAALGRIALETASPQVLRVAIEGLAVAAKGDGKAERSAERVLFAVLARADETSDLPRDELLVAFARLGAGAEAFRALYLELPIANAAAELEARFDGRSLVSREFLYRGDLRATVHLARFGRLADEEWSPVLGVVAARAEGRLLIQLAAAVRGGDEMDGVFRRLLLAAAVALEGEPSSAEVELELARVYATLLGVDLGGGRFASAAAWASRLGRDWHLGVMSDRVHRRLLGDPRSSPETTSYLPAAALQAKAYLANSQGRGEAARALAVRGRAAAGESKRALEVQALLDAALRSDH